MTADTITILLHAYGGGGILSGFLHPLLGLDHLLAMVAVGLLSAQLGGKAIWQVPATFVAVMAVGFLLGYTELGLPLVEFGIAGSVVVLGIALAADRKLPLAAAITCVGLFALFHGHAHGTELPAITETAALIVAYVTGFLVATAVVGLGAMFGEMLRVSGGAIAALGLFILLA